MKNLKKQEIQEKMEEIRKVTGADMSQLESLLADSAYDPDRFEEQMQSLFDDRFYEQEDEEFMPARAQAGGDEDDEEMEDYEHVVEEDTEQVASGSKGFKQARLKAAQTLDESSSSLKDRLEEYYNLDYEDMVRMTRSTSFLPVHVPCCQLASNQSLLSRGYELFLTPADNTHSLSHTHIHTLYIFMPL